MATPAMMVAASALLLSGTAIAGLAIAGPPAWDWFATPQTPALALAAVQPAPETAIVTAGREPLRGSSTLAALDSLPPRMQAPIRLASVEPNAVLLPEPPLVRADAGAQPAAPAPLANLEAQPNASVPLPVPRPSDMRGPVASEAPAADPQAPAAGQTRTASLPNPTEDNRSFLEKLFNVQPGVKPAPGTAIYDISARTVTLPSGETLEAHSGYGEKLDDPQYVHVPMRGATPPGTYELKEREKLFHGVRALRMNPVGGNGAVYNRVGLLAHTFMLGPKGDSNGCVSFRDYDKFLQAYLRGEVQRLVVVTGRGQDQLPSVATRQGGSKRASLRDRDA